MTISVGSNVFREFAPRNGRANSTNPGLTLGGLRSDPLPLGNITAFGVYLPNPFEVNQTFRIDTYEITVVPEPGTTVLLLIGGCALVLFPRRRRRRAAGVQDVG